MAGYWQFKSGERVRVRFHLQSPVSPIEYPEFTGVVADDCRSGGWELWHVIRDSDGQTVKVYGISLEPLFIPQFDTRQVLGILGDSGGEYGSGVVFIDSRYPDRPTYEWWDQLVEDEKKYTVYSADIDLDILAEHDWVDVDNLSNSTGEDVDEIEEAAVDPDPVRRAYVLQSIAQHYGSVELDSSPKMYSPREMALRWPNLF